MDGNLTAEMVEHAMDSVAARKPRFSVTSEAVS